LFFTIIFVIQRFVACYFVTEFELSVPMQLIAWKNRLFYDVTLSFVEADLTQQILLSYSVTYFLIVTNQSSYLRQTYPAWQGKLSADVFVSVRSC